MLSVHGVSMQQAHNDDDEQRADLDLPSIRDIRRCSTLSDIVKRDLIFQRKRHIRGIFVSAARQYDGHKGRDESRWVRSSPVSNKVTG